MMKSDVNVAVTPSSVSVQAAGQQKKKVLEKLQVQAAANSTMTLNVMGSDVKFTLREIPANHVDRGTMVWLGNERVQDLLDAYAVSDLIPSFKEQGQQVPAFGRDISGIIEVADGSRRRFTALETKRPFYVWVGDLSYEQMQYLSEIGNQYNPTSAYEKGKRYQAMLTTLTQEQVAEAVNVSRKAMMRCVQTAGLPIELINCFQSPNDISARQGESFFKGYKALSEEQQVELVDFCVNWLIPAKGTGKYSKEDLVTMISGKIFKVKPKEEEPQPTVLPMGATLLVKKGTATLNVPNVSKESLMLIELAVSQILSEEALKSF